MNYFSLRRGTELKVEAELRNDRGLAPYDPACLFTTTVWPGNDRLTEFTAQTAKTDPAGALILITVPAALSILLDRGRYQLLTEQTPPGGDPIACYQATIEIEAVAGTEPEPPTYCTYEDMLRIGRTWVRQLATVDDERGFADHRARARTWLEDVAYAHDSWSSWSRSTILRDALAADTLVVTDQVREATAKKALAYLCEAQVGLGEQATQYARLARMYHSQADALATSLILEVDRDGDGVADMTIDCTHISPLEG